MPFPSQDFTNQFISLSYQNVVQTYVQGTASYFLDGLGNILGFIPTSSVGQQFITADQPAPFAITASYLLNYVPTISSSWASQSLSSSVAISASFASNAQQAIYATLSATASLSLLSVFSDTSSYAFESTFADTASLAIYADNAGSSSYISASNIDGLAAATISSSYSLTSSFTTMYPDIIDNSGSNVIISVPTLIDQFTSIGDSNGSALINISGSVDITGSTAIYGVFSTNCPANLTFQFDPPSTTGTITEINDPYGDFDDGNGNIFEFQIYPYIIINGTQYFGSSMNYLDLTYNETGTPNPYHLSMSWNPVPNVSGYRILIVEDDYGYSGNYIDRTTNGLIYDGPAERASQQSPVFIQYNFVTSSIVVTPSNVFIDSNTININSTTNSLVITTNEIQLTSNTFNIVSTSPYDYSNISGALNIVAPFSSGSYDGNIPLFVVSQDFGSPNLDGTCITVGANSTEDFRYPCGRFLGLNANWQIEGASIDNRTLILKGFGYREIASGSSFLLETQAANNAYGNHGTFVNPFYTSPRGTIALGNLTDQVDQVNEIIDPYMVGWINIFPGGCGYSGGATEIPPLVIYSQPIVSIPVPGAEENTGIGRYWTNNSGSRYQYYFGTGSVFGTSSYSYNSISTSYITSSNIYGIVASASYSFTAVTASYVTASNIHGIVTSASFSTTASYLLNYVPTVSSSWASSSYSSSYSLTSSYALTASYITASGVIGAVLTAQTAYIANSINFVPNSSATATQSLFSTQSSYSTQSINAFSASWVSASAFIIVAQTASYVTASNVIGKVSIALTADTASYLLNYVPSISSSWASASLSASYAATASYILGTSLTQSILLVNTQSQYLVFSQNTSSLTTAVYDYSYWSASNGTAGHINAIFINGTASYSNVMAQPIGGITDLTMSIVLTGSLVNLYSAASSSINWRFSSKAVYF